MAPGLTIEWVAHSTFLINPSHIDLRGITLLYHLKALPGRKLRATGSPSPPAGQHAQRAACFGLVSSLASDEASHPHRRTR